MSQSETAGTRGLSENSTLHDPEAFPDELIYAILSGATDQVQRLTSLGVDVLPQDAWIIYEAVLQGPGMIDALCTNPSIDLNPLIPGQMGDRAFHFALRASPSRFPHGKVETVRYLLCKGVDPFLPDRQENTAIHILAGRRDSSSCAILQLLLSDDKTIPSAIRSTCLSFLDRRNRLAHTIGDGKTALIMAVSHDHTEYVQLLLENGADPNTWGGFTTPLSTAIMNKSEDIAKMLRDYGGQELVLYAREPSSV